MVGKTLRKVRPSKVLVGKLAPFVGMVAVGVVTFVWARFGMEPVRGQVRDPRANPLHAVPTSEYDQRVVAYIYGNMPITRAELGEFLIARFGAERLDFLVNQRIVELACKSRNIQVTDAMVEAQLDRDLKGLGANMNRKDFQTHVLKRFGKTMYEWKEDVIRPKLMLAQFVEPNIQVTEEELKKGFEGRYGPKVQCRWLVLPDNNQKHQIWEKVKGNEAEFVRHAKTINLPQLCDSGGVVPPIHKNFGDPNVEKHAFNLKVGEVSPIIGLPDKTVVILWCDQHIPPDLTKRFENERLLLEQEIRVMKLNQRIPEVFAKLRETAAPNLLLRAETRQSDLERAVVPEISGQAAPSASAPTAVPPVPRVGGE